MLETLVHIGQHKTGTTSLQHFLKDHRADFSKRGLYVPDSVAEEKNPSHFLLNVYALNENRYSPMKENLFRSKPKRYFSQLKVRLETDIKRHYLTAEKQGCQDVIWSNEGLYLLNTIEEYHRLRDLFKVYSKKITAICCFREKESYKFSYSQQLKKQNIDFSEDKGSYRYINDDSWLFDYQRKIELLNTVFDEVITYPYNPEDNVSEFLKQIDYPTHMSESIRLNVTK